MIIEALAGLVMNVFMADNATGQNLTRGLLMASKIENMKQDDQLKASVHEEANQIFKDIILKVGEQKNDNGNP